MRSTVRSAVRHLGLIVLLVVSLALVAVGLVLSPAPWFALVFVGGCGAAFCLLYDPGDGDE